MQFSIKVTPDHSYTNSIIACGYLLSSLALKFRTLAAWSQFNALIGALVGVQFTRHAMQIIELVQLHEDIKAA
jgi:hypothetical protein